MKRYYSRFRAGLMAFALGLAAVYMANGLSNAWSEVRVELPTAVSGNVLPVFTETPPIFRRGMNCGEDPSDERRRNECIDKMLFGKRDMSRYARYETMPNGATWFGEKKSIRDFVWLHFRSKKRAHLVLNWASYEKGHSRSGENHYFIEPEAKGSWQLVTRSKSLRRFIIDGRETEVPVLDEYSWTYRNPRWKIANEEDRAYFTPGTRYLEFENLTGDTVRF